MREASRIRPNTYSRIPLHFAAHGVSIHSQYLPSITARHQASLSNIQRIVLASPDSKSCRGSKPRSAFTFEASIA
jgi:hypothetical protein